MNRGARFRPPSDPVLTVSVAVLVCALYAGTLALGLVNFAQWDNLETFLPAIWNGHSRLLRGSFPLWNPQQNLGEPLHAFGNGGVLYPVYTVLVALTRAVGASPVLVLQASAVLHGGAAAGLLCLLARDCGARRPLAVAAGLAMAAAGYNVVAGTLWVHLWPNLVWQIVAMIAVLRVVRHGPSAGRLLVAATAQAMPFLTGHIQTAAIAVLSVWIWVLMLLLSGPAARRHAIALGVTAIAGPLIAAPANLPTLATLAASARVAEGTLGKLFLRPQAVLGMLVPTASISPGFMGQRAALAVFVGAWVPIALGAGFLLLLTRLRRRDPWYAGDEPAPLPRLDIQVAALGGAVSLLVLSLGDAGGLYFLLRQLPPWNDTRWAYRFLAPAMPFLVLSGALILEQLIRSRAFMEIRVASALGAAAAVATLFIAPPSSDPAWIAATVAIGQIGVLGLRPHAPGEGLATTGILLIPLMLSLARPPTHPKDYAAEAAPGFTPTQLEVLRQHRVLPLSESTPQPQRVRVLGTYYSAMLDGYTSATGHRFGLSPRRVYEATPSNYDGVPFPEAARRALASDWPFVAGVGFLIVRRDDAPTHRMVRDTRPDASVAFESEHAVVYAIELPGPPVLLVGRELANDSLPRRGALPRIPRGNGRIRGLVGELPEVTFSVQAERPSVAVVSTLLSEELSIRLDDRRVRAVPVFGGFLGVEVPAGTHAVEIRIRRWPLRLGFVIAAGAMIAVLVTARLTSGPLTSS